MKKTHLYSAIHGAIKRAKLDTVIIFATNLVSGYWKKMKLAWQMGWLRTAVALLKKNVTRDYHIGGQQFHDNLEGSMDDLIMAIADEMSPEYLEIDILDDEKVIDFPEDLKARKGDPKSYFKPKWLFDSVSGYQNNPDLKKSRSSRYNEDGTPKTYEVTPLMKHTSFQYYDALWYGIKEIMKMSPEDQHDYILTGLEPDVNSGYPLFKSQSKKSALKDAMDLADFVKFRKPGEYLTVTWILALGKHLQSKDLHFPYVTFYRSKDIESCRAVFGGHYYSKLVSAIVRGAKKIGMKKASLEKLKIDTISEEYMPMIDVCKACKIEVKSSELGGSIDTAYCPECDRSLDDSEVERVFEDIKLVPTYDGIPLKADLPWDVMYNLFLARFPKDQDDISRIMATYWPDVPFDPDEDVFDIIGEDYSSFDKQVLPEELYYLKDHKHLGWLFDYFIGDMEKSKVWLYTRELADVIFKSGFPFTANFGTDVHKNRQMAFVEWHKVKYPKERQPVLLGTCNQSDDNISWWLNLKLERMEEWATEQGLIIKPGSSYSWQRSKIVRFLQVDIGTIKPQTVSYIGNLTSRILGLLHSERDMRNARPSDMRGDFIVTGDLEVDAYLSKLASFGKEAGFIVLRILWLNRDTKVGRAGIAAVNQMTTKSRYKLYRDDVKAGFNPYWMISLKPLLQAYNTGVASVAA